MAEECTPLSVNLVIIVVVCVVAGCFIRLSCRYVLSSNGSLIINDVRAADAAVYKCVGYTNSGPVQTFAVQLILACKFILYRTTGITSFLIVKNCSWFGYL